MTRCPNASILYTTDALKAFLSRNCFFSFSSSSVIPPSFEDAKLLTLTLHLSSFKYFAFFEFAMPSQNSENSLKKQF